MLGSDVKAATFDDEALTVTVNGSTYRTDAETLEALRSSTLLVEAFAVALTLGLHMGRIVEVES